ncbi:hypothetical protein K2173_015890 [Erythroxylum novogranatense]|uniref:LOB domain-containing protein n=1 Tax=Erythroxylum novogranatense TaxID=1862640 RepID=A0AAV8SFB2_9ROSI|nr:hypothetical protein K2173_015890 [Erythroxylum novogranatense]
MNRNGQTSNNRPCAVCKLQRKRCEETCEMAAYFPGNRFQEFQNAHKLFGVGNIMKLMGLVEPNQRTDTAMSLLLEANARAEDPVHGCLGIVQELTAQIELHQRELQLVNQQLEFFRGQGMEKHQ